MPSEPNLRLYEAVCNQTPYGYGAIPIKDPHNPTVSNGRLFDMVAQPAIRPLGAPPHAESRPQLSNGDPKGNGLTGDERKSTDRARDVLDLIDLWDKVKETFKEVPGLWRSLLGILATPFRWLGWIVRRPLALVLLLLACAFLAGFLFVINSGCQMRDARRAEGDQLMGSARDFARVAYSKTGSHSEAAKAFEHEVDRAKFDGEYFQMSAVLVPVNEHKARIYVFPIHPQESPGYMEFDWASGNSAIFWDDMRGRR